ncbi:hypothetical protein [Lutibacter sp.]|uniref:hypothetical protein n=1 Tax=Lutibacter sp. TaxID=1925666 RepID=UPI0034A06700
MTLEKELAKEVLTSIEEDKGIEEVNRKYKNYLNYISKGQPYDVKLFNVLDHKHTKYLLRKLE